MKLLRYSKSNPDYKDYQISLAVVMYFVCQHINITIKTIMPFPEGMWGLMSAFWGVVIVYFYYLAFKYVKERNSRLLRNSYIVFLLAYLFTAMSLMLSGQSFSAMISGSAFLTFAWWIPSGVYACSVCNRRILYDVFLKWGMLISICMILCCFKHPDDQEYNMSVGFGLLIPTLFHYNELITNKNKWFGLYAAFETLMILAFANRGCLLGIAFFLFYKYFFMTTMSSVKIFLIIFGVAVILNIETIVTAIAEYVGLYGFESRTLMMFLNGDLSNSTGRDEIWKICFKMIDERPILGWGLGGEFNELALRMGASRDDINGAFTPHNGVIQNIINFGWIFGIFATIFVTKPLFSLKSVKDSNGRNLILIFASAFIVPALVSSSGFFITPAVAVAVYLYHFSKKISFDQKKTLVNKCLCDRSKESAF